MKEIPKIEQYMTPMPHSINAGLTIGAAKILMKKHGFRHLPVDIAGKLVGVITDRDLHLAASFDGAEKFTVEDLMTPDPYCIPPETPLNEVLITMVERKYGCAIIMQENKKVVGIFTATDGLRAFAEVLDSRFKLPTNESRR
jgi:acetoin utilization protein AcuB